MAERNSAAELIHQAAANVTASIHLDERSESTERYISQLQDRMETFGEYVERQDRDYGEAILRAALNYLGLGSA